MKDILVLRDISLGNKNNCRLNNINLSIRAGEKVAILGKSGSGKTSLLKVVNGTIKPNKGSVSYDGVDLQKITRKQKSQVGTLWQDIRLIEELSVNQNINTGILGKRSILWAFANLTVPLEQKECINCLKAAQLPLNIINKNVKELSSGQRTRVAIAKLLRQKAKLLIADEALTALDPNQAKSILVTLLNEVEYHSYTIPLTCLFSLHQPQLISLFTRVIGIKEGEVFFDLNPLNVNKSLIHNLYK